MIETVLHREVVDHDDRRATIEIVLIDKPRHEVRGRFFARRWQVEVRITNAFTVIFTGATRKAAMEWAGNEIANIEAIRAKVRRHMSWDTLMPIGEPV